MATPVQKVTIKAKFPLYKKEELAERVELITLEETGFELVAQKNLYEVGDTAVYIQPDYCVPETPLFQDFIAPSGDPKKSYLGKIEEQPRRIRAIKFALSKEPNGEKVYSNGILLPLSVVTSHIGTQPINAETLGITKYEAPIKLMGDTLLSPFPSGWYQTDEENINNVWNEIQFPIYLIGTQKIDGTSISISTEYIATRKNVMERFVKKGDKEVESTETYIRYGSKYQDILRATQETTLVLRGELNGQGVGSSGNKLNPALKEAANIRFFGIDNLRGGITYKLPHAEFIAKAKELGIDTVPIIFEREFNSKEELLATCEAYFAQHVIEGIVVKTPDARFSAKIMNNYYDSKK